MTQPQTPEALAIQTMFNQIAPVYDRLNDWLSFGIHRVWKSMAVKWAEPKPGNRALDLCCGSGDLTFILARQITGGQVVGVDFAEDLLALARQKAPWRFSSSAISWVRADALDLPFGDNYFDCATLGYGLRNLRDISGGLRELYRVLRPQGKAAILDFNRPENPLVAQGQKWYLENVVVRIASSLGFEGHYAYIFPSLARFPTRTEQIQLARAAKFSRAIHYELFGGIMGVLVVTK